MARSRAGEIHGIREHIQSLTIHMLQPPSRAPPPLLRRRSSTPSHRPASSLHLLSLVGSQGWATVLGVSSPKLTTCTCCLSSLASPHLQRPARPSTGRQSPPSCSNPRRPSPSPSRKLLSLVYLMFVHHVESVVQVHLASAPCRARALLLAVKLRRLHETTPAEGGRQVQPVYRRCPSVREAAVVGRALGLNWGERRSILSTTRSLRVD